MILLVVIPYSVLVCLRSFGVVLWELLTGEIPYKDVDSSAIIWGVGSNSLHLPVPSTCPGGFKILMKQTWWSCIKSYIMSSIRAVHHSCLKYGCLVLWLYFRNAHDYPRFKEQHPKYDNFTKSLLITGKPSLGIGLHFVRSFCTLTLPQLMS